MQERWLRSRLPKKFTSNHHKHVFLQSSPDILRAEASPDLHSAQRSPAQTPKQLKPVPFLISSAGCSRLEKSCMEFILARARKQEGTAWGPQEDLSVTWPV